MSLAQLEHAPTLTDPQPAQDRFEKLFDLLRARNGEIIIAKNRRLQLQSFDDRWPDVEAQAADRRRQIVEQLAQAKMRRGQKEGEIDDFILEVARLLVAEADAEAVTE